MNTPSPTERVRLDKWLWAARLYRTRGLATEAIDRGAVRVNTLPAKAGRELHVGDRIELRQGGLTTTLIVCALSSTRRPAVEARNLYQETTESQLAREQAALQRRQGVEPAQSLEQGRPTKRDRRQLAQWQRWSVSIDPDPK